MFSLMRIKECQSQLERNKKNLDNLKNINDENYIKLQSEKIKKSILDLETEIQEHLSNPVEIDPEIKKIKSIKKIRERRIIKKEEYKPTLKHSESVVSETTMNNFYKKLVEIDNSLPEYIFRNLKNMPNNRGYIWRNVWYFGEKDPESNIVYLTEPKKGFVYLHEIYPEKYLIFSKKGRENPVLVSMNEVK